MNVVFEAPAEQEFEDITRFLFERFPSALDDIPIS